MLEVRAHVQAACATSRRDYLIATLAWSPSAERTSLVQRRGWRRFRAARTLCLHSCEFSNFLHSSVVT